MEPMVITTSKDLKKLVKEAYAEFHQEAENKTRGERTYTINQVAKRLHMAHQTIGKLVKAGVIKSTASGRITEAAIEEYLSKK